MKSLNISKIALIIFVTLIIMITLIKVITPNNSKTIEIISNSASF